MPQPNEIVNIWTFVTEWNRCHTSSYQRNLQYREARFDSCGAQWDDLKIAMRAKIESDEDVAKKMIDNTHFKKTIGSNLANSPTAGHIWEMKSTPGWDV
mmetsp:Transcript_30426/g.30736  ORF Transcript_30426/g.30736 Transcript_30426/m.30736 type:complete len:99 (-) Transcript_30426:505-801(-)